VLHYACKYGQLELVTKLVELGANVNGKDFREETPLHKVAAFAGGDAVATAKYLLEHGALLTQLNSEGDSPIAFAQQSNKQEVLQVLQAWATEHNISLTAPPQPHGQQPAQPSAAAQESTQGSASEGNQEQKEGESTGDIGSEVVETPVDSAAQETDGGGAKRAASDHSMEPDSKRQKIDLVPLKCKLGDKVKMTKVPKKVTVSELSDLVKQKFELDDVTLFKMNYADSVGDTVCVEDNEDLEILLDNPQLTKLITIVLNN